MSCYHPLYMLDLGYTSPKTGKTQYKILPNRVDSSLRFYQEKYGKEHVIPVPCGHCLGCRLDKAREWSFRCVAESLEYGDNNSFITLTYDDDHLPSDMRLHKDHFQKFIKAIRNLGYKVRYFGCGEYGEHTSRPHYHLILFNYFPHDAKVWDSKKSLFTSVELDKAWSFGRVVVGQVTYQSAGYVARYTLKKLYDPGAPNDEFILMSKKPGIGQKYVMEHANDYSKRDHFILFTGGDPVNSHFRYADKVLDTMFYDIDDLKLRRKESSEFDELSKKIVHHVGDIEIVHNRDEVRKYKKISALKRGL